MNEINTTNIAILIDGDNIQADLLENILAETGKFGKVTVRRIYGDWTMNNMKSWKEKLNRFAIRPMQQFAYTKGKNSTDSAMIIDAMDILHKKLVNAFCLVSSDSDYTGLANRIREEGVFVMGIGKANTPEAFQKACELFIYTENLKPDEITKKPEIPEEKPKRRAPRKKLTTSAPASKGNKEDAPPVSSIEVSGNVNQESDDKLSSSAQDRHIIKNKITKVPLNIKLINKAFEMAVQDDELAFLSEIGLKLRRLDPSFDPRTYGFGSLTSLFKSLAGKYEIVYKSKGSPPFIRMKK
jgi:uncharacterized LabA/DUF88 family protein